VIADIEISYRFNDNDKKPDQSIKSCRYLAPEAIQGLSYGRREDVWSILYYYVEILAFLKDRDLRTIHIDIHNPKKLMIFFYSHDLIMEWLNTLKPCAVDKEKLTFIQLLLDSFKTDQKKRPYTCDLAKKIQAIYKQRPYQYIGECCAVDETANTSSNLKHAVGATLSTLPNPENLEKGSLLHFIANTALSLEKNDIPEAYPNLDTLYAQACKRAVCSIRSAERKFLFIIAPIRLLFHFRSTSPLTRL
jgi:hypothetical protein